MTRNDKGQWTLAPDAHNRPGEVAAILCVEFRSRISRGWDRLRRLMQAPSPTWLAIAAASCVAIAICEAALEVDYTSRYWDTRIVETADIKREPNEMMEKLAADLSLIMCKMPSRADGVTVRWFKGDKRRNRPFPRQRLA